MGRRSLNCEFPSKLASGALAVGFNGTLSRVRGPPVPGSDLQGVARLLLLAHEQEMLELVCTWGWG